MYPVSIDLWHSLIKKTVWKLGNPKGYGDLKHLTKNSPQKNKSSAGLEREKLDTNRKGKLDAFELTPKPNKSIFNILAEDCWLIS